MSDQARRLRAQERQSKAIIRKSRTSEPETDVCPIRGAEAVSLVFSLTKSSWALAGLALPDYSRARIPFRFVPRQST
jgi:hypothetical protein